MSALRELYQELIIDHGRNPRNFGSLDSANHTKEGYNPLCGDKITVYLQEKSGVIEDLKFEACGCAISVASASLMSQALKGKSVETAEQLFEAFHQLVTGADPEASNVELEKLIVLAGVSEFPARVKCASLAWHTMLAALKDEKKPVSTE